MTHVSVLLLAKRFPSLLWPLRCLHLLLLFLLCPPTSPREITLASFNIRNLSTVSRDDRELGLIADRLQPFDLIAIQEVLDEQVIARLLAILNARGHAYQAVISPPADRQARERYAFVWRTDVIRHLGQARLWPDPQAAFIRTPYIAGFRAGAFDFLLVNLHLIFGESLVQRRAEARLLDEVYHGVQEAHPDEQDVLLIGDFNLPPEDPGFSGLNALLTPLFTDPVKTTISDRSLFDNIWCDLRYVREFTGATGIEAFDETVFGDDDAAASRTVSDHRPIWARFRINGPDDDGPVLAGFTAPLFRTAHTTGRFSFMPYCRPNLPPFLME